MNYTGARSQREQAHRQRLINSITRTAAEITGTDKLERLLLITQQIQHIDLGTATRAEQLRDIISIWTIYHDDLNELKDMQEMICIIATRKARQVERAKQQHKKAVFVSTNKKKGGDSMTIRKISATDEDHRAFWDGVVRNGDIPAGELTEKPCRRADRKRSGVFQRSTGKA